MVSPALAAGIDRDDAAALIEGQFRAIDSGTVLLWKGIDVGAPQAPTMYDKVQLHIPADADVYPVWAAFTARSGDPSRYQGRDYVSFYEFYQKAGSWQAVQVATDGVSESDPYYMN